MASVPRRWLRPLTRSLETASGPLLAFVNDPASTGTAALAAVLGNRHILSITRGGSIREWDASRGMLARTTRLDDATGLPAISPDGTRCLAAGADGAIRETQLRDGAVVSVTDVHNGEIERVGYADDASVVAIGRDGTISWAALGTDSANVARCESATAIAAHDRSSLLATAHRDNSIRIWRLPSLEAVTRLTGHYDVVRDLAFSPDGRTLLSAADDQSVFVWDVPRLERRTVLTGFDDTVHRDAVSGVAWDPDGRRCASVSRDGLAVIWDLASAADGYRMDRRVIEHGRELAAVTFADDGRLLVTGGPAGMWFWDLRAPTTGAPIATALPVTAVAGVPSRGVAVVVRSTIMRGDGSGASDLDLFPESQTRVTAVDAYTGAELLEIRGSGNTLTREIAVSDDGRRSAVIMGTDVALLDLAAMAAMPPLRTGGRPRGIALSGDGSLCATGGDALRLWEIARSTLVVEYEVGEGVRPVSFRADGSVLAETDRGSSCAPARLRAPASSTWSQATMRTRLRTPGRLKRPRRDQERSSCAAWGRARSSQRSRVMRRIRSARSPPSPSSPWVTRVARSTCFGWRGCPRRPGRRVPSLLREGRERAVVVVDQREHAVVDGRVVAVGVLPRHHRHALRLLLEVREVGERRVQVVPALGAGEVERQLGERVRTPLPLALAVARATGKRAS